jgi:hypothetical protein
MKRTKRNIIIAVSLLAVIVGAISLAYVFRGTDASVKKLKADYQLSPGELFSSFDEDEAAANEKFVGKIIEVEGIVAEIEKNPDGSISVLFECNDSPFGCVRCNFDPALEQTLEKLTTGSTHTIKGNCAGMLMDVILDKCYLIGSAH